LNPDTVTHLSTNRAQRRLTLLIEANALTTTLDRLHPLHWHSVGVPPRVISNEWCCLTKVIVCCVWRCGRVLHYEWNLFQRSLCELHGRLWVSLWSRLWTHSTEDFLSRFSFFSNSSSSSSVTILYRLCLWLSRWRAIFIKLFHFVTNFGNL